MAVCRFAPLADCRNHYGGTVRSCLPPALNGPAAVDKAIAAGLAELTPSDYVFDTVRFVVLVPLEPDRLASPA
jgi:hypothetical protein